MKGKWGNAGLVYLFLSSLSLVSLRPLHPRARQGIERRVRQAGVDSGFEGTSQLNLPAICLSLFFIGIRGLFSLVFFLEDETRDSAIHGPDSKTDSESDEFASNILLKI